MLVGNSSQILVMANLNVCLRKFDLSGVVQYEQRKETAQDWNKSFTHIEHRTGKVGREGLGSLYLSSLMNIYFRLSGFQSSFLLIHFRYRPKTCPRYIKQNNNNNNLYLYSLLLKNNLRQ